MKGRNKCTLYVWSEYICRSMTISVMATCVYKSHNALTLDLSLCILQYTYAKGQEMEQLTCLQAK